MGVGRAASQSQLKALLRGPELGRTAAEGKWIGADRRSGRLSQNGLQRSWRCWMAEASSLPWLER